ncbi:MAG: hypothetical protein ACRCU3_10350 [Eubacteriaceae bacterium]
MKRINEKEGGFVLPIVIVILALLLGSGGYFLGKVGEEFRINKENRDYQLCILTGYNAISLAQSALWINQEYKGEEGFESDSNGGVYSIRVFIISKEKRSFEIITQLGRFKKRFHGYFEMVYQEDALEEIKIDEWKMGDLL